MLLRFEKIYREARHCEQMSTGVVTKAMSNNNSIMIKLHETKRMQRGNPAKCFVYMYHSALKGSMSKEFIFIVPTMDCHIHSLALAASQ